MGACTIVQPAARAFFTVSRVFCSMLFFSITPFTASCSVPPFDVKSFWYSIRTSAVRLGSISSSCYCLSGGQPLTISHECGPCTWSGNVGNAELRPPARDVSLDGKERQCDPDEAESDELD